MKLLRWKPLVRNTLRGFTDFEFESGLRIFECPVRLEINGRVWIALPGKAQLDRDGNTLRNERGKVLYVPTAAWAGRDLGDRFSEYGARLLLAKHPDALAAAPQPRSRAPP